MAESTQRFSGRSLEEAIGNATDVLGSGAEVIEAKRVRRGGILGMMKHDSYEVSARARAGSSRSASSQPQRARDQQPRAKQREASSFDFELRSMIDEVDLREERQLLSQAPPRSARSPEPQQRARAGSGTARVSGDGRSRVANRFTDDDLMPLPDEPVQAEAPRRRSTAPRQAAPARATAAPRPNPAGLHSPTARRESPSERELSRALASSTAR